MWTLNGTSEYLGHWKWGTEVGRGASNWSIQEVNHLAAFQVVSLSNRLCKSHFQPRDTTLLPLKALFWKLRDKQSGRKNTTFLVSVCKMWFSSWFNIVTFVAVKVEQKNIGHGQPFNITRFHQDIWLLRNQPIWGKRLWAYVCMSHPPSALPAPSPCL